MSNPSRVGLGQLSLRMLSQGALPWEDVLPLEPSSLVNVSASLDTWAGGVSSSYSLVDASGSTFHMAVRTSVHPDVDLVATNVSCEAADGVTPCPVVLRLAFGYPDGAWGPTTANYDPGFDELSSTVVLNNRTVNGSGTLSLARMIDDTSYEVHCEWNDPSWSVVRTGVHRFVWLPPSGAFQTSISLSCLFVPFDLVYVSVALSKGSLLPGTLSILGNLVFHTAHRNGFVCLRSSSSRCCTRFAGGARGVPFSGSSSGCVSSDVAEFLDWWGVH